MNTPQIHRPLRNQKDRHRGFPIVPPANLTRGSIIGKPEASEYHNVSPFVARERQVLQLRAGRADAAVGARSRAISNDDLIGATVY